MLIRVEGDLIDLIYISILLNLGEGIAGIEVVPVVMSSVLSATKAFPSPIEPYPSSLSSLRFQFILSIFFSGHKETNVLALPHNSVPDELEGVTNGTLANIIRQLSSLSRHAEEMFGNLSIEAEGVAVRSSNLQAKIDKLAVRVTQLDSTVEEGKVGKILFC